MKDDRLLPEDDLRSAFRAVRDAYDGENEDANLTLQRALFRTRVGERRRRLTRWVVLPFAAVLVASTAWAAATGRLTPVVTTVVEAFHPDPTPRDAARAPATTVAVAAPSAIPSDPSTEPAPLVVVAPPVVETAAPPRVTAPPASAVAVAPPPTATAQPLAVAPAPITSEPAPDPLPPAEPAPTPSPAASAPDPFADLFAEAHRLHFIDRDPARALVAWDRYLTAAPNGRLAPEARYNRALTLVRLGRHIDAKRELAPFATGVYGTYRRDDARALLDALAREAGAP